MEGPAMYPVLALPASEDQVNMTDRPTAWPMPVCLTARPLTTVRLLLTLAKGASSAGATQLGPVVFGTQCSGRTPLPQKKTPSRFGMDLPAASAVPRPLYMISSGGNP